MSTLTCHPSPPHPKAFTPPPPATLQFLGLCVEPLEGKLEYMLLAEFCVEGSLDTHHARLRGKGIPELGLAMRRMQQLASGVLHVHSLGYMHRDLKPANILVHGKLLKLADFGLACLKPEAPSCLTAETGSYRWMAPEVMRHEPYDSSCDVYSFALVAWEMLTYELPFVDLTPVEAAFAVADKAKRPEFPDECPADVKALIVACWDQELNLRPSFEKVVTTLSAMLARHAAATPDTTPKLLAGLVTGTQPVPRSSRIRCMTPRKDTVDFFGQPRQEGSSFSYDRSPSPLSPSTRTKRAAEDEPPQQSLMKRPNSISSGLVSLAFSSGTSPSGSPPNTWTMPPPASIPPRITLSAKHNENAEPAMRNGPFGSLPLEESKHESS